MSAPSGMRVGFVGAGRIGRPMVRRLLAAGHTVRVHARSEAARRSLAEDGADTTPDVREAGAGAAVVGVCVHNEEQVRQVCLDDGLIDAMEPGSVLVVHTTGGPRLIELLAERGGRRGIAVVDAPISGGPDDVAAGSVALLTGGAAGALDRARPVLRCYGDPVLHCGPAGSGQRVKLINNAVFAANIGLLAEAVAVAERLGVEEESLLACLRHSSGSSRALNAVGAAGSVASFANAVREFLDKDLAVVRETVGDLGVGLGVLGTAHDVLARLLTPPVHAHVPPRSGA